jgi:hypothetical protein
MEDTMYRDNSFRRLFRRGATLAFALSISFVFSFVESSESTAQNFPFRRLSSIDLPLVNKSVADTAANSDDPLENEEDDEGELLAHVTVSSLAADAGAFAEADGMGTATNLTPIDSTTVAPTVDATYFLRAVASEDVAIAESFIDEGMIEAPGTFELEGMNPGTQLFLNGFLYIAENGGFVEIGDGASAELDEVGMSASINGSQADGSVELDEEGVKTAILSANLPGLTLSMNVGSINHLFHFVVPVSIGSGLTMGAIIDGNGGNATTELPGDFASIQWSFKATAWAYVTTFVPQLTVGTTELLFGDFNGNGVVDAADFTVWRDTFGQTGADLAADADGDGTVDEDDYKIWKLTFGLPVTSLPGTGGGTNVHAIPEPRSFVLALVSLLICTSLRFRSRVLNYTSSTSAAGMISN